MIRLLTLLLLLPCFAQAATKIYTGFNYGAFWSVDSNVKQKADFLDGFNLAKNLTTPIPFDSARLFTCRAGGTLNDPISAFDAAVESKTNLLLGFWITPGEKGDSPDENVNNEMIALEKGFKQHGQALSDLIIGLSVGNEDVYRSVDPNQIGVSADVVSKTIEQVKKRIATSSFAQYMKDKPIGHVDTAQYAVVDNADFIGMTAYPYWNNDSIEKASTGFQGSLESVKQRAGNRPVWIGEMGWPFADSKDHGEAVASAENLQKYWTEVGCAVIGKYTTFWFELLWDGPTDGSQPDFGLMDITSRKARIKDLSCGAPVKSPPAVSSSSSQVPPANSSSAPPNVTTSTVLSDQSPVSASSSSSVPQVGGTSVPESTSTMHVVTTIYSEGRPMITSTANSQITTHVNTTINTTLAPSPIILTATSLITTHVNNTIFTTVIPSLITSTLPATYAGEVTVTITITTTTTTTTTVHTQPPASPRPTPVPSDTPWCHTMAEIDRNGESVTVAGSPAGPDGECSPPPTYNGYPYITTVPSASPTHVPVRTPWCVTMADIDRNGHSVAIDAGPAGPNEDCSVPSTYSGFPYVTSTLKSESQTPKPSKPTPPAVRIASSSVGTLIPSSSQAATSSATSKLSCSALPPPMSTRTSTRKSAATRSSTSTPASPGISAAPTSGTLLPASPIISAAPAPSEPMLSSSSGHPYSIRLSSRLGASSTAPSTSAAAKPPTISSASAATTSVTSAIKSLAPSGGSLSDFMWPTPTAAAKADARDYDYVEDQRKAKREWIWWRRGKTVDRHTVLLSCVG